MWNPSSTLVPRSFYAYCTCETLVMRFPIGAECSLVGNNNPCPYKPPGMCPVLWKLALWTTGMRRHEP